MATTLTPEQKALVSLTERKARMHVEACDEDYQAALAEQRKQRKLEAIALSQDSDVRKASVAASISAVLDGLTVKAATRNQRAASALADSSAKAQAVLAADEATLIAIEAASVRKRSIAEQVKQAMANASKSAAAAAASENPEAVSEAVTVQ